MLTMVKQRAVLLALIWAFVCPSASSDDYCPATDDTRASQVIICSGELGVGWSCYALAVPSSSTSSSTTTSGPQTTRDPDDIYTELKGIYDTTVNDPIETLGSFRERSKAYSNFIFAANYAEEKMKRAFVVEKALMHVANAVLSELEAGKGTESAASMLTTVIPTFETVGPALASALPMGDSKTARRASMEMVLRNFDLKTSSTVDVQGTDNDVSFEALLTEESSSLAVSLISVAGNVSTALNNLQIVGQPQDDRGYKPRLSTDIVTVSVANFSALKSNVSVGFKLSQSQGLASPICVSITKEPSGSGLPQLDASGCTTKTKDANHIVCSCNHLSSFAILMSVTHKAQVAQSTDSTLELLSTLCLSLSIAFLAISFITFWSFKNLQSDRNTIHMNLSACLLLGQLLFLVAIDQTANKVGCAVIAGILHFLFLAAFHWMANEGMHIYLKLVLIFEPRFNIVPYLYGVGYGTPLLIVVVAASSHADGYGMEHACWLKTEGGFIYSFVGPVCVVAFLDFVMLVIAISVMVHHSRKSNKKELSSLQRYRGWVKGSSALLSVLGITWVFGIFSFGDPGTVVFAYIFNLLNGAQGVAFFIFHCYLNDKVRREYRRVLRKMTWLPDPLQRCYTGLCRTWSTTDLGGMSSMTSILSLRVGTLTLMQKNRFLNYRISRQEKTGNRPATVEEAGIYLGDDPCPNPPSPLVEADQAGIYFGDDPKPLSPPVAADQACFYFGDNPRFKLLSPPVEADQAGIHFDDDPKLLSLPVEADQSGIYFDVDPKLLSPPVEADGFYFGDNPRPNKPLSSPVAAADQVVLVPDTAGDQPPPQPTDQDLPSSLEPSLASTDRKGTNSPTSSTGSRTHLHGTSGIFGLLSGRAVAKDQGPK